MTNLYTSESANVDNLIAGYSDLIIERGTVVSGEGILARGHVLGTISASGKFAGAQTDGTDDGRRTASRVLAEDIDATDGDIECAIVRAGELNENVLSFSGTDDADDHRAALNAVGIILRPSVAAV